MSEISNLSREALIDLIRKQKNNKIGSYPKNNHNKSHSKPSELEFEEEFKALESELLSSSPFSDGMECDLL